MERCHLHNGADAPLAVQCILFALHFAFLARPLQLSVFLEIWQRNDDCAQCVQCFAVVALDQSWHVSLDPMFVECREFLGPTTSSSSCLKLWMGDLYPGCWPVE